MTFGTPILVSIYVVAVLFVLEAPLSSINDSIPLIIEIVIKLAWFCCVLFSFVWIIRKSRLVLPFNFYLLFFIIFLSAISSLSNIDRLSIAAVQFFLTYSFFVNTIVFANIGYSKAQIVSVIWFVLSIGFFCAVIGLLEFVIPDVIKSSVGSDNLVSSDFVARGTYLASQSVFSHPGLYAWFMSFCFCIALSFSQFQKGWIMRVLAITFYLAVLVSLRKKAIFSATAIFFLTSFFLHGGLASKIRYIAFASIVTSVLTILFFNPLVELFSSIRIEALYNLDLLGPRIHLTLASLSIAVDHFPFGAGLSTFGSWMSSVFYSDLYFEYGLSNRYGLGPENKLFLNDTFWPMLIAEIGFIGSVLYFLMIFGIARRIYNRYRSADDQVLKSILLAALLVIIEGFIESLSTPIFSKMPISLFIGFLAGVALTPIDSTKRLLKSSQLEDDSN